MLPKGHVEAGLLVCAFFTLSDDKGTTDLVISGRERLGVSTWNNDGTWWNKAPVRNWFAACDVDDVRAFGQHHIGTENGFFAYSNTFNYDATRADEAIVFDDGWGSL